MNLSDNEKRDVIKYLESGKPLPEKYRFLLFDDDREVELVWNGKTNEVTNTVLPFQTIEHIDEPRSEDKKSAQASLFDTSGRQIKGWTNKLIWGDNKLILSSLKNGPMRKEIEAQGGLKLIYIDPPFDVGADFSMNIEIGDETFTKQPSVIEEVAYRDTWGKGADSFIAMIYERLKLMHDLLTNDGSIYVHCDHRVNAYMRMVLDEIFGQRGFKNEIIWYYETYQGTVKNYYPRKHDTIFFYTKSDNYKFELQYAGNPEDSINFERWKEYIVEGNKIKGNNYPKTDSRFTARLDKWIRDNKRQPNNEDVIFEVKTMAANSVWKDIKPIDPKDLDQKIGYPTQKPETLLERIIKASTKDDDLIADFFCGSGTTSAVAEKLGRKWLGSDLGRFGIHTTRKRMIGVQRELKKTGKDYRAFEILNIGKYERQYYVDNNPSVITKELTYEVDSREFRQKQVAKRKEREYINLILLAYKAEPAESFNIFVGKKRDRLVAIGAIDLPITSGLIQDVVKECKEKKITKADVLGFDYEMGLDFEETKKQGLDIQFKKIPREVFDKKAVEKGQVKFYDVAYLEAKPIIKGRGNKKTVAVELTDFSVFYNQEDIDETEEKLRPGGSKIVIENGQVIKIFKDKETELIEREVLTKNWSDWVDYWAVDFDFENRKEIIKVTNPETEEEKEEWTGSYIFENEWQSFRTKKNKKLELITSEKEVGSGKYKIAVKVVDIFGNDTTKVIEIKV
jgi:DNA modification methylase